MLQQCLAQVFLLHRLHEAERTTNMQFNEPRLSAIHSASFKGHWMHNGQQFTEYIKHMDTFDSLSAPSACFSKSSVCAAVTRYDAAVRNSDADEKTRTRGAWRKSCRWLVVVVAGVRCLDEVRSSRQRATEVSTGEHQVGVGGYVQIHKRQRHLAALHVARGYILSMISGV